MKNRTMVAGVLLAVLLSAQSAYAQRYDRRDREWPGRAEQGRYDDLGQRATRSNNGPLQTALPEEGAGPARNIFLGDQLPWRYANGNYVVEDWAAHGLSLPPSSFKWYQVGADYVLVSTYNGRVGAIMVAR